MRIAKLQITMIANWDLNFGAEPVVLRVSLATY
jgi:hypothetical protein